MKRYRACLAAALLTVCAALGTGVSAAARPAVPVAVSTTTPSPDAPHRGTVTLAHRPADSPAPGRDRAVRAFAEGRREQAAARRDPISGRQREDAGLTHNWWGVFPRPGTHDGIMATHSVDPAYRVSDAENFTYAPTTKAQNSCMEMVTAYWNTGDELWAWDWCSSPGGPARTVAVNADFLATYTTNATGHPAYTVQMTQDDPGSNQWSAYLYNYRTSGWDLLYRQSGSDRSGLDHGWDMFEIYASTDPATGTGYYCTEARGTVFDSSAIQLRKGGTWSAAGPANSPWTDADPHGSDFLCPGLRFVQAGANDHWMVKQ
ncbi:carbohydrate-binding protein [Streptomyces sp. NPDC002537]